MAEARAAGAAASGAIGAGPRLSPDLRIAAGRQSMSLPAWSRWLIDLGAWLGQERLAGKRSWTILTVPTRDYAAAFVALGAVMAAAGGSQGPDAAANFEFLRRLPPGTAVRYREGKRRVRRARLEGCGPVGHEGQLAVRLSGGYSRLATRCSDIEPLEPGEAEDGQVRVLADHPEFVEAALSVQDAGALTYWSKVACLIVGTRRSLEADLLLPMAVAGREGTLQDLVRCRSLLAREGDGFLADIASASREPGPLRRSDPGVVVLDGPSAILRWRSVFRQQPTACIIDLWHPSARAASDALMSERARGTTDLPLTVGNPPSGIGILSFSFGGGQ